MLIRCNPKLRTFFELTTQNFKMCFGLHGPEWSPNLRRPAALKVYGSLICVNCLWVLFERPSMLVATMVSNNVFFILYLGINFALVFNWNGYFYYFLYVFTCTKAVSDRWLQWRRWWSSGSEQEGNVDSVPIHETERDKDVDPPANV